MHLILNFSFFFFCDSDAIPGMSAETSPHPPSAMKVWFQTVFFMVSGVPETSQTLVVLCTFEIIGILVAKQRCQQWPGGPGAPPPVISLSFFLSQCCSLKTFSSSRSASSHRFYSFPLCSLRSLARSLSNFTVIFLVLNSPLKHCPTMNINKAENINSPSVLSSSQAWLK